MNKQQKHFYEFGPFHLDTSERVLLRDGAPVSLTPKALETLIVLVQYSGHLVEKDDLMKMIWPDAFVEEAGLTRNVSVLRKVLGKDSADNQYIETVPKRGYRFIAVVSESDDDNEVVVHRRAILRVTTEEEIDDNDQATTARPVDYETARRLSLQAAAKTIAVLPFVNAGANPEAEYLSDGITESIINNLSHLPQLHVMARSTVFRYKGRESDPQEVGQELGVHAVLVGRVLQFSERLIIRTELVGVESGYQLWGEQYNREPVDIFAVQEEIAREISETLRLKLGVEELGLLAKRYTESTAAYHTYLKGRYFFYKRTQEALRKGIEYFQQAIEIDPTYALAYSGMADCYAVLSMSGESPPKEFFPKAKAAALEALEIDDTIAEAHTSLAMVRTFYDLGWTAGETEFRRAIKHQPGYALAHHWYGWHLLAQARFDESIAEMRGAQELDPLSPLMNTGLGSSFHFARRHDRAIEQYRQALDLDPNFALAHHGLGWAYEQKGMYREAILEFQKASILSTGNTFMVASLSHAYAVAGERGEALRLLTELQEQTKRKYVSPYAVAIGYTGLREQDQAFEWLEKSLAERAGWLVLLKVEPRFDSLRDDPRCADIVQRIGLEP